MTDQQLPFPTMVMVERPPCPKCGRELMLARIEPDSPGHDKRTFECPACNHVETVVVKYG